MSKLGTQLNLVYDNLFAHYGELGCPLHHANAFQLLAAVMLSAQCRDDRVNEATRELFRRFPDPATMAEADVEEVAELIRQLGLFRNKSKNLVACAQKLVADFNGVVPHTIEELTTLPGIGRKSANVVLGNAFGLPGFPVDTHVNRVLNKLGLSGGHTTPEKIEEVVNREVAPDRWSNFSHLLIQHGRDTCHARTPACDRCMLQPLCPSRKK